MTPASRAIVRFLAEQIAAQQLAPPAPERFDRDADVEQNPPAEAEKEGE